MKIPDGKIIYEKYLLTPDGEVFSLLFVNKNAFFNGFVRSTEALQAISKALRSK